MKKQLSLIVATYNRGDRILRLLESLLEQDADVALWEFVVVNNNSKDNTREVVEEFMAQHPTLDMRLVDEPRQGLSYARNCGIESTALPIIVIVDDDEILFPRFISSYLDFFARHEDVASAGGAITPLYDSGRPRWVSSYCEYPIACPISLGDAELPFPRRLIPGGGNMGFRRSVFDKYGLFDPELGRRGDQLLGGEESNLFVRLRRGGEQVWYIPTAESFHIIPAERLERSYLDKLWYNIGVSHYLRAGVEGRSKLSVLVSESMKWVATFALLLYYIVSLRPSKGLYLLLMRSYITRGILSRF